MNGHQESQQNSSLTGSLPHLACFAAAAEPDCNNEHSFSIPIFTDSQPIPPLVFPPSLGSSVTAPLASGKKRRSRARTQQRTMDPETLQAHAERNRWFARQSRERKRIHVEGLEKEITSLKAELQLCKQKLAQYELIDKQRHMTGEEGRALIFDAVNEMAKQREMSPKKFSQIVIDRVEAMAKEKRQALEQLSRMMLEIAVPLSLRLFLWEAESGIDIFDPDSMGRVLGYKPDTEESRLLMHYLQMGFPDRGTFERIRARMVTATRRIRNNVKLMIECQRGIQLETHRIWCVVKSNIISTTTDFASIDVKFTPKLQGRPELSDAAIFQLRDENIWPDMSTDPGAGEDEDENSGKGGVGEGCATMTATEEVNKPKTVAK